MLLPPINVNAAVITAFVSACAAHSAWLCCCALTSVLRLMALSFVVFLFFKKISSFSSSQEGCHLSRSKDAWGHLFYLIITLAALLHSAALSLLCHLKCLAGLFSETIMKLCANTPPTAPPPSILQPCVQEPERRFLHRCPVNRKTNRGSSIRPHLHPTEFFYLLKFCYVLVQMCYSITAVNIPTKFWVHNVRLLFLLNVFGTFLKMIPCCSNRPLSF